MGSQTIHRSFYMEAFLCPPIPIFMLFWNSHFLHTAFLNYVSLCIDLLHQSSYVFDIVCDLNSIPVISPVPMALCVKFTFNKYRDGVFYFVLNDQLCQQYTVCWISSI